MKPLLALMLCLAVSGCATRTVTVEVPKPIPVPCVAPAVREPQYPTGGADIYEKVRTLLAELELRKGYEVELQAALAACR